MDSRERAMLYPFDIYSSPIIRHHNLINDYCITNIVSPNGWGLNGKDAGCADGGNKTGINISSNFDEALTAVDTVIFTECLFKLDFKGYILPKINKAIDAGKNIVSLISMDDATAQDLAVRCEEKGVYLKFYNPAQVSNFNGMIETYEVLQKIETPVIFVMGLFENCQKFEIQLSLRENMQNMGYKVSQIGSKNYCGMFGFHSFPGFMYNSCIPESQKVVLFNHYIRKIEIEENPDVIIIGVPGAVMRFNDILTNRFGILAYEVCQAITPDAVVLSVLYDDFTEDYFKELCISMKYKLGVEITCFNMANIKIDIPASIDIKSFDYVTLDAKYIEKKKQKYSALNMPVYNILIGDNPEKMTSYLVDRLADNGTAECI